jgi:hypothetical protein
VRNNYLCNRKKRGGRIEDEEIQLRENGNLYRLRAEEEEEEDFLI